VRSLSCPFLHSYSLAYVSPFVHRQLSTMSQTVSAQIRIVVVMGPTGTGKSTFIKCATGQDSQTISHSLRSGTEDVRAVRAKHPDGSSVVFVDTPGFNGPSQSDVEILSMITDFLMKTFKEKANLATIIYLHKIDENRMTGSILKNLKTFASFCGKRAMPNVIIATTMWGKVGIEEGSEREKELKGDFWKDILDSGCRTERFEKTYESAWGIIGNLATVPDSQLRLRETRVANEAASKGLELEAFTRKLRAMFSYIRGHH